MLLTYSIDKIPSAEEVVDLYRAAGLPRPIEDVERIGKMYEHSNLVVTAWDGGKLAGVSRCITDWVWSCYLADLAVRPEYQKEGVGRKLIDRAREALGELSMLLLLSVPTAFDYYPKVGFEKENRAFMIPRKK